MPLFSILTPLEDLLRHVLVWLHSTVGLPWAWSIVALTMMVRIILVPLTVKQIHSMQSLQRHAPQMKEIQKKYRQDKKKQQEELMRFYKENQINPAASCLPLLAQFPVFIALYFVLKNFTHHIHALAHDLSWLGLIDITKPASHGWGPLLLVIYAGSQIASTFFMSATMDKTQRTLLLFLPLVFITFIMRFPAGLVLYWVTTNLWTVGQGIVTRQLIPKTPAPTAAVGKRPARPKPAASSDGAKRAEPQPQKPAAEASAPKQVRKVKRKKKGGARR
jgi:YidC/Oxa1 family membrane protein insertase